MINFSEIFEVIVRLLLIELCANNVSINVLNSLRLKIENNKSVMK